MKNHGQKARYRRVSVPEVFLHLDDEDPYRHVLARDSDWLHQLPWIYRAMASPWGFETIPEVQESKAPDYGASAYWTSLLHLLIYHLGWVRPDRGMLWWLEAGRPTEEPILAFVAQVWGSSDEFDRFAAWLLSTKYCPELSAGFSMSLGYERDERPAEYDRAWVAAVLGKPPTAGTSHWGSGDNLHLCGHVATPIECVDRQATFVAGEREMGRAVLLMDSLLGWYATLAELGGSLPSLGDRSWRVEVIVRPIGHLGVFRRSRETGLWFACRHQTHVKGV